MAMHHETPEKIERTAKSATLYRKVFGELVDPKNVHTILDVGAGDSFFAEHAARLGQEVTRIDSDYNNNPPNGENWVGANATDLSDFEDQYDAVVSAFMMQHLSSEEQGAAIVEMIKAAKKRDANSTPYQGVVAIYPVYERAKLKKRLKEDGLSERVFVLSTGLSNTSEHVDADEKHLAKYATLYVAHEADLDEQGMRSIAESIAGSGALYRRTTMSDLVRRAFMGSGVTRISR